MTTRQILVEKIKDANEILTVMRDEGYGNLNIIDSALANFQKIVGGESNIFKIPSRLSEEKKKLAIHSIDKFLSSKWVTKEGRDEILQKRINTFTKDKAEGGLYGLNEETTLKLFDIFESRVYHQIRERNDLDSDQIIDIVKHSSSKTTAEIVKAMENAMRSKKFSTQARYEIEKRLGVDNDTISKRNTTKKRSKKLRN